MAMKFTNNAATTLATGITNSATSLTVSVGTGVLFPTLGGSDYFYCTLANTSGAIEIIKVTARSTDTFTVTRGQDGTSGQVWNSGDKVELRLVAASLNDIPKLDEANTFSANNTFSGSNAYGTPTSIVLTNATSVPVNQATGTLAQANGGTGTTTGYYGFKNRIINGAMVIDQRNAGAVVTPTSSATAYATDRWALNVSQNSKLTAQQSSAFVGFTNSLLITSSSAYSVASGDYFMVDQNIEGLNVGDLGWGTANAQTVTLSFKVKSSLTGTFGGVISNSANNRSYPFSYTISSANTETSISVTIAGDTSGTWLTTNGVGIRVRFSMGVGSTYQGTAGAWAGATYLTATGATSVVGTNGATFYITGVQLEKGSTATSFDYRPYGTELALCQRYYEVGLDRNSLLWSGATVAAVSTYYANKGFAVVKRASPTVTTSGEVVNGFASGSPSLNIDTTGIQAGRNSNGTATGSGYFFYNWQASAEL